MLHIYLLWDKILGIGQNITLRILTLSCKYKFHNKFINPLWIFFSVAKRVIKMMTTIQRITKSKNWRFLPRLNFFLFLLPKYEVYQIWFLVKFTLQYKVTGYGKKAPRTYTNNKLQHKNITKSTIPQVKRMVNIIAQDDISIILYLVNFHWTSLFKWIILGSLCLCVQPLTWVKKMKITQLKVK